LEPRCGPHGQLSGVVHDAKTGEPVLAGSVAIPDLKQGGHRRSGNYGLVTFPRKYPPGLASGFRAQLRQNSRSSPTSIELDLNVESTVLTNVPEVVILGERPLIQKDATGSREFLSGDDIKYQPLRGYQDASPAVRRRELQANSTTKVRTTTRDHAGRAPDEVAYYVDGFSHRTATGSHDRINTMRLGDRGQTADSTPKRPRELRALNIVTEGGESTSGPPRESTATS